MQRSDYISGYNGGYGGGFSGGYTAVLMLRPDSSGTITQAVTAAELAVRPHTHLQRRYTDGYRSGS